MTFAARNDEIVLALGAPAVRVHCRASLRAATRFVREDGFVSLAHRLAEFHLSTIRDLITVTAIDRQAASAFIGEIGRTPLKIVADAIASPIAALVAGFIPAFDEDAKPDHTGKLMPWPKVYRELFRTATGWLGWPPEAAWNASPTEIYDALAGLTNKLKAVYGAPDPEPRQPDPAQAARNIAEGLDPEFDREGLRALKAKITGKRRG